MRWINKYLNLLVLSISVITVVSGLSQAIAPEKVLSMIGVEGSPSASYFFGVVGMFMTLFGGLMVHVIYSPQPQKAAVFWCALQKLAAFVAVTLGVVKGIFSLLALAVAFFDLFSGLVFLIYLKQDRK
ncbi:MAG TPA: hypothetical protein VK014_04725 [Cyclobacteriaceae bacterium]|nr:hypothetical protein [Cyclobacteriaceae bacterium]